MSGQSASLSVKEAREIQKRTQHSGSHAESHGGGRQSSNHETPMKKKSSKMKDC